MKIYWSGDSKYNRRKSPRAAIGKEMVTARFGDKSAAARLRMLRPHHPPHRKRRPLRPRLRSQSPRQGLQRFLRIPIRRLKRSLRERFHYFIHGKRQQCRIPQAVCRRATVTRASRSKARLRPVATRRDSWRSHVRRTQFRRPRSSSSYNLPMQNFSRGIERGILSFEREYPPFIRAVPSALLFPIHAQREKSPLICKDKKTTPRCCEFLRSSSPLRRASRAPHRRGRR